MQSNKRNIKKSFSKATNQQQKQKKLKTKTTTNIKTNAELLARQTLAATLTSAWAALAVGSVGGGGGCAFCFCLAFVFAFVLCCLFMAVTTKTNKHRVESLQKRQHVKTAMQRNVQQQGKNECRKKNHLKMTKIKTKMQPHSPRTLTCMYCTARG